MENENDFHPLARELAQVLDDHDSLPFYQGLIERFSEHTLKETLKRVLAVPENKIRKSRAAYFNYLMQQSTRMRYDNDRN